MLLKKQHQGEKNVRANILMLLLRILVFLCRDISEGQIVVRTGDLHLGHRDKYEQEFNVEAVYMHNNYQSM